MTIHVSPFLPENVPARRARKAIVTRTPLRKTALLRAVFLLAVALTTLGAGLSAALAVGAKGSSASTATAAPAPGFRLDASQPELAVPVSGTMRIDATATVPMHTDYLELRLRVFSQAGTLMLQKTEIRHDTSRTVSFHFSRAFKGLDVTPGKYRYELQVRATGTEPFAKDGYVLVYDPKAPPVKLAVVAGFACVPGTDPDGHFTLDPSRYTASRLQVSALSELVERTPGLKLSAALPPIMLDEWSAISGGYRFAGPEGLTEVPADNFVPRAYAGALASARNLAESPDVELLNVPYAEPDLGGLQSIDGLSDLSLHYREGTSVYLRSLGTTPSPATTIAGSRFPDAASRYLRASGVRRLIVDPSSLAAGAATITPGVYKIGNGLLALAADRNVSAALQSANATRLAEALIDRAADASSPVCGVLSLGTGSNVDLDVTGALLTRLSREPWIELVRVSESMHDAPKRKARLRKRVPTTHAPSGYWPEVSTARDYMRALQWSAGADDREAAAVRSDVLSAESRCWAGPDLSWSLADRGRAFSAAATRRGEAFFGKVTIEGQNLTLSGTRGELPLNIRNNTGRLLRLRLVATTQHARFPKGRQRALKLQKGDNFLTLPIDLGSSLSVGVHVALVSGDTVVAYRDVRVRGSYLDRIAVVGTVAAALVAMLFFIRKRVRAAEVANGTDAANIKGRRDNRA